jgi:hypothetical protein
MEAGDILEKALLAFHNKYGHLVNEKPTGNVHEGIINLRIRLINEEVNEELIVALNRLKRATPETEDTLLEEVLDGAVDSIYVILGTLLTLGLPFGHAFAEVQRSNMSKTAPDPNRVVDPTQKYQVKTPKGPDFEPPNLSAVISLAKGVED